MNFAIHFGFSEQQFTGVVQGLIFIIAAVYVLLSLSKVRRAGQAAHLKWLVPLAIYTVDEAITYAISNIYWLFSSAEPEPLNTITDIMDDVSLLAFLWALIVLWRIIRTAPDLLKTPWLSQGETLEGVWPPAPRA
jgi:hypothetical protein